MQTTIEALTESIRSLENEVTRLRREFQRRTITVILIAAALVAAGIFVLHLQIEAAEHISRNNSKLCPVLKVLADNEPPATTPRGARVSEQASRLLREFRCD